MICKIGNYKCCGRLGLSITIVVLCGNLFYSCSNSELERTTEYLHFANKEIEVLENKILEIENAVEKLDETIIDLRSEVDDFYYEDWKHNVPDVENATNEVEYALDELKVILR